MKRFVKINAKLKTMGVREAWGLGKAVTDNLGLVYNLSVRRNDLCITRTIENYFLKMQMAISTQTIYTVGNLQIIFTWLR